VVGVVRLRRGDRVAAEMTPVVAVLGEHAYAGAIESGVGLGIVRLLRDVVVGTGSGGV